MTVIQAAMSAAGGTLASQFYARLRREIVRGILLPGEKLRIESLRSRYGVGASPIREALNRLSADGLVQQQDQKGFQVSPVSLDELFALTRTRYWVNEVTLRESIANGDAAWEEGIVLAFHRMSRTPRPSAQTPDSEAVEWEVYHRRFHASLVAACGSRWLLSFAEMLFESAERYRHLAAGAFAPYRDPVIEHRAIMEATLGRDTAAAIKLLNHHARRTVEIIVDSGVALPVASSSAKRMTPRSL
jgi:GntR family transcriptional regulator, carbon starvation induced regulator